MYSEEHGLVNFKSFATKLIGDDHQQMDYTLPSQKISLTTLIRYSVEETHKHKQAKFDLTKL